MKQWISILKSELSLIFEDKSILLTCLMAPILYAFLIGSTFTEKEVYEIPVAVVDFDQSNLSRKVSQLINTSERLAVNGHYSSIEDAMFLFNNLEVQGIVILPKDFQKKTMNLDGANMELIINNTKFLTSSEINKSVQKVVLTVAGGVRMQYFISNKIPYEIAKQKAQPIIPVIKSIYNTTYNYGDYLSAMILILILQQTLFFSFGQSMIHEFKHGVLNHLETFSFFGFIRVLSAKSFYYILLYTAYFFVFFKLIFPHFSLSFNGSIFLHLVLSVLFISVLLIYTILLASFFKTMIGWVEVMAFSTYPLFLVSGFSWPVDSMPIGLKLFANILPSTPYYNVFNALAKEGAKLENITNGFLHLLVLFLVGYVLLYVRFRLMKLKKTKFITQQ